MWKKNIILGGAAPRRAPAPDAPPVGCAAVSAEPLRHARGGRAVCCERQAVPKPYLAGAGRRHMSSDDCRDDAFDLNLVRSYLPLLVLMLRSTVLVCATQALAPVLGDSSIFALLCVLVYFDAVAFWRDSLNRAAGFLLPTAFVVYVNLRGATQWPADTRCLRTVQVIPYWVADVAWAASSSVVFVSLCMRVPMRLRMLHVTVTWALMALAHILLGCLRAHSPTELVSRLLLYYITCAFFFLSSMVLPGTDRNVHTFTVVHVNMHVLFVEVYVLAVSVCISVAAYACLYYQYNSRAAPVSVASAVVIPSPAVGEERKGLHARPTPSAPHEDLLAELRAAKAAPREAAG